MQRVLRSVALSGLVVGIASANAFADEPTDTETDSRHNTEQPREAEQPVAVLTPEPTVVEPGAPAGPKFGDLTTSGYLRGSFGASNQKGRMTCFKLALPGGMFSKYRLGNECEVWAETDFFVVADAGGGGAGEDEHGMQS